MKKIVIIVALMWLSTSFASDINLAKENSYLAEKIDLLKHKA